MHAASTFRGAALCIGKNLMNSLQQIPRKRNTPPTQQSWQAAITQAKRRVAVLQLLVDCGSCPVAFCLLQIPSLTMADIRAMRDLNWIGLAMGDDSLYLKDAGRALL